MDLVRHDVQKSKPIHFVLVVTLTHFGVQRRSLLVEIQSRRDVRKVGGSIWVEAVQCSLLFVVQNEVLGLLILLVVLLDFKDVKQRLHRALFQLTHSLQLPAQSLNYYFNTQYFVQPFGLFVGSDIDLLNPVL